MVESGQSGLGDDLELVHLGEEDDAGASAARPKGLDHKGAPKRATGTLSSCFAASQVGPRRFSNKTLMNL